MQKSILASCFTAAMFLGHLHIAAQILVSNQIHIDQFGYLPESYKIAAIGKAQWGYNAPQNYIPGPTLQVRRNTDHLVVMSGPVIPWNSGQTHDQSGDKIWHFDFSAFNTPGDYYLFDPQQGVASYTFTIANNVYAPVLRHAVRMLYYQRCGTNKPSTYAGADWADGLCFMGPQQDTDCRLYSNPIASTSRDLHGGWFDAGDYNKYVNFARPAVTDFLLAYMYQPNLWTDDYQIPESGNGIPDLLDEIKWELDWLLRMQLPDGAVLSVVGGGTASPPSSESAPRYYGPPSTAASFSAACMFALGSKVYAQAGQASYATTLQNAAIQAYSWAEAHPGITFYNTGVLAAGEQQLDDYGVFIAQLCAAIFLFDITSEDAYKTFVQTHYTESHLLQWGWVSMFDGADNDALLHYAGLPGVPASTSANIRNAYRNSMLSADDHWPAITMQTDPYMAFLSDNNYTWGSNQTKSREAHNYLNLVNYNLETSNAQAYTEAAAGYLHYLHGLNPNGLCFLTRIESAGADFSCTEMYHSWFGDNTQWDDNPPPGYLVGGPNPQYNWDACCQNQTCGNYNSYCNLTTLTPPLGQPIQKAYKNFNTSWPQNSWEITEPALGYQSAYIKLLAAFVADPNITSAKEIGEQKTAPIVFPNPAFEQVTIEFTSANPAALPIGLFDAVGRRCLSVTPKASNDNSWVFDLSGLPPGVYFLCWADQHGQLHSTTIQKPKP